MTAKTKKPSIAAASRKPAAVVASRTATGKTAAEAAAKIDYKGLAKEAAAKMAARKAAAPAAKPANGKSAGIKGWNPLPAKDFAAKVQGKKVHLLVKGNPKHGKSAKRFAAYKEGMAVEAALKAGVLPLDLQWDSSAHHRGGAYIAIK
jgi:hypothetical protein